MAEIPDKPFYKIGDVCQYTDTQPYVLRFWESEFPSLAPEKSRAGQRMYTRRDIDMVLRIKKLLYEEEFTIAGARKKLEQEEAGVSVDTAAPETPRAVQAEPAPVIEEDVPAPEPEPPRLFAPEPAAAADPEPKHVSAAPASAARSSDAPSSTAPSPAERARAVVAETEMGVLRKRIAELEGRQASMTAALQAGEEALRRERERRERVAARLESLLASLDRASGETEAPELDGGPRIS